MDKAIYVGFALLELSKLHMNETHYDKLQPNFRLGILQIHYIDTVYDIEYENRNYCQRFEKKIGRIFLISVISMEKMNYIVKKKTKKWLVNFKLKLLKTFG